MDVVFRQHGQHFRQAGQAERIRMETLVPIVTVSQTAEHDSKKLNKPVP